MSVAPVRIALLGAAGRMGMAVIEAAAERVDVKVLFALVRPGSAQQGVECRSLKFTSDLEGALAHTDVLLDFSLPESTSCALKACLAAGKPLVTGVTGMSAELKSELRAAASHIPVLAAPNMSVGVALLTRMVEQAARLLDTSFDVEIHEAHHKYKKDAPSGTALALGETVARVRGVGVPSRNHDRSGPRQGGSIGYSVVRAGDIVGEHTVIFAGAGERLELTHRAQSRQGFAQGALSAARWIADKPAGAYSLADMLSG